MVLLDFMLCSYTVDHKLYNCEVTILTVILYYNIFFQLNLSRLG